MTFANVIPIDAEVARQLVRRQVRFRWLVAALAAVWLAVLIPSLAFTPLPPVAPFIALAVLVVLAEHRFVLFGDETSMSASIIVGVASIFVFAPTAPLAGPILIASLGGIYIPHLRTRSVNKLIFNASGMGLAAWCAAAITAAVMQADTSIARAVCTLALAVATYWVLNNLIVAGHQATLCGRRFVHSARMLIATDTEVLLWTAVAGLGVLASHGSTTAPIGIVTCAVILRVVTMSGAHRSDNYGLAAQYALLFWLCSLALLTYGGTPPAALVALCLTVAIIMPMHANHRVGAVAIGSPIAALGLSWIGLPAVLLGLGLASILVLRDRNLPSLWTYCVAVGSCAAACAMSAASKGSLNSTQGIVVVALIPPLAASAAFALATLRRAPSIGLIAATGLAIPGPTGLASLVAVIAIALASTTAPFASLGLATAVVATRFLWASNAQRSSAAASR